MNYLQIYMWTNHRVRLNQVKVPWMRLFICQKNGYDVHVCIYTFSYDSLLIMSFSIWSYDNILCDRGVLQKYTSIKLHFALVLENESKITNTVSAMTYIE